MKKTIILDHQQIEAKIRRIAYQIYESNVDEKQIILAGIATNGYVLAEKLKTILDQISKIKSVLCKVEIDKKNPLNPIRTSIAEADYTNESIVMIDDVLNSGSTLIYAVKHFLNVPIKRFKTAVLVNRNHKKFPVKADFKGISLSTSLNEHVVIELSDNNYRAYLK
ncbi:pyrimidine operon attenuation protein / uracil phosphoribosyltransferase [Flavobacteriaceae bacterium MAR_2010_188]|nr:pyrimidine operon attenuation protein / uracil phosphoribosyltransferase [Flavobacteriaceae bacterium MAR_2010_188]